MSTLPNSSQVLIQWNQGATTTPIEYYIVTARPHVYTDNFSSPTVDSLWTVDRPDTLAGVNTVDRPGFLRVKFVSSVVFEQWTTRGKAPNVFRSYEAVGSWSASVYVDCTNTGIVDNVLGGLMLYESANLGGLAPQYRITWHTYPAGNVLGCDFAGTGGACGGVTSAAGMQGKAFLRMDYNKFSGLITFLYKWTDSSPWLVGSVIPEQNIWYGAKLQSPRVGIASKVCVCCSGHQLR